MEMRIACTIAVVTAAFTLAPRPAEAACPNPGLDDNIGSTKVGGAVLEPVGPHPILNRTLVAVASTVSVRATDDLSEIDNIPVLAQVQNTPNPVDLDGGGKYAAYIAQQNAILSKVDPLNLIREWSVDLSNGCSNDNIVSAPAVHLARFATPSFQAAYGGGSLVYVATSYCSTTANRIFALNADSGQVEWVFNLTGALNMDAVFGDPFLDVENDRLYVATDRSASDQDSLWAIDTLTGNKAWSANVGRVWTSPVVRGDRLYVVTLFGEMKALSVADGSVLWTVSIPTGNPITTNMFTEFRNPFNGLISTIDFAGNVWLVQDGGVSGSSQWVASLPGAKATSRVAIDPDHGKVYVGADDGKIYQLNIVDGSVEASRLVTEKAGEGVVGVPTLVFEDTNSDGRLDTLRMLAGSSTGHVAKFCMPWAGQVSPIIGDLSPLNTGVCEKASDCGDPPTQCSDWACKDGVCATVPKEDGTRCEDGNEHTFETLCVAGTCAGVSRCDLNLDSCVCVDENGEQVERRLHVQPVAVDCPPPPIRNMPQDWCATEIVTLTALNQCLGHNTESQSVVAIHLFDQHRRPFTDVGVRFTVANCSSTAPVWIHPQTGEEIQRAVSTQDGGIVETERDGTYFAILATPKAGGEPGQEPCEVTVDLFKTSPESRLACIDTSNPDITPEIPPVFVFVGDDKNLLCPLDSNRDSKGYLRIAVQDANGNPVDGAEVTVGYVREQNYFFSDYRKFIATPLEPDLPNTQVTVDGFVEFFDFGHNMNGPLDIVVNGQLTCIDRANAIVTLGELGPKCSERQQRGQ
jgi:outer membrane protein assembly factor BamB